jgi:hypothetical protein
MVGKESYFISFTHNFFYKNELSTEVWLVVFMFNTEPAILQIYVQGMEMIQTLVHTGVTISVNAKENIFCMAFCFCCWIL